MAAITIEISADCDAVRDQIAALSTEQRQRLFDDMKAGKDVFIVDDITRQIYREGSGNDCVVVAVTLAADYLR